MSLDLLKRAVPSWQDGPVVHYLLLPLLPESVTNEQLIETVILASVWRIRRDRPYAIAFVEDETRTRDPYVQSLEARRVEGSQSLRPLNYVGMGDVSPFAPKTEDDLLMFFRNVPPPVLPPWPEFIIELDAVLITRVDEYIKVSTSGSDLCKMLDDLPLVLE